MGKKKIKWGVCSFCGSKIPEKYLAYHENVACLVMRGLKPAPEDLQAPDLSHAEEFTARPGEDIQDLMERMRKK